MFDFKSKHTFIANSGVKSELQKVLHLLIQKYYVPREDATRACAKFLKSFRSCPDNDISPLEIWRKHLWAESLGETYAHLTGVSNYPLWLPVYFHSEYI
nr:unnamed protein product [Callosobruchus analis]